MTLKRYKAKSIVSIGLYGKGAIDFMPDSKGGSYYSTTDKAVQKAIESSGLYCDGVVKLVSSEELVVSSEELVVSNEELKGKNVTDVEVDNSKVYADVTKCVDAIAILRDKYGITEALNTKAKIIEVAKGLGVIFPKL